MAQDPVVEPVGFAHFKGRKCRHRVRARRKTVLGNGSTIPHAAISHPNHNLRTFLCPTRAFGKFKSHTILRF